MGTSDAGLDSRARGAVARLGRPRPRDVIAGLVTGLFSTPEGMAYASIGVQSRGCTRGCLRRSWGSLLARAVLMVTTLTSAIALSSQSVLATAGLEPTDAGNIAMLAVLVGVIMLLLGAIPPDLCGGAEPGPHPAQCVG
ncbi:MAG TPA: hypothetical protein VIW24_24735 [Aldersonia sp.]